MRMGLAMDGSFVTFLVQWPYGKDPAPYAKSNDRADKVLLYNFHSQVYHFVWAHSSAVTTTDPSK